MASKKRKSPKIKDRGYWSRSFASIRRDHTISMGARLLASEIDALSQKEGYCWASNGYLSEIFRTKRGKKITVKTISSWVTELVEAGHISRLIDKIDGNIRYLSLMPPEALARLINCEIVGLPINANVNRGINTDVDSSGNKCKDPINANVNSSINTRSSEERKNENPSLTFQQLLKKIPDNKAGKTLRTRFHNNLFLTGSFVEWFIVEAVGRFSKKIDLSDTDLKDWEEQYEKLGSKLMTEAIKEIKLSNKTKGNLPSIGEVLKAAIKRKTRKLKIEKMETPQNKTNIPIIPLKEMSDDELQIQLKKHTNNKFQLSRINEEISNRIVAANVAKSKEKHKQKQKATNG